MTTIAIIIIWVLIFAQIAVFIKSFDELFIDSITFYDCRKSLRREKYYVPIRIVVLAIILIALC